MLGMFHIFAIILITAFVVMVSIAINLEKRGFNNGVCPKCRTRLRHFDTDSHGGRGYICDKCRYYTWVSYPSIDRDYEQ